ncbi:gluconate permease [bacterium]|nr:gluconate permease [bacterium]
MPEIHPLFILAAGLLTAVVLIIVLRLNAFLSLITASLVVSLMSPGAPAEKISRVAEAFGATAGKIGIVIALAAVTGSCLIRSGAADRIVRFFVYRTGEKRCEVSLLASGFFLSIPVFYDTVFYLLLPLARSMHVRTKKNYLLLVLCMGAGASITHSLVPPTPGPLIIAGTLGVDIGTMILVGILVSLPTAFIVYFFIRFYAGRFSIPMREFKIAGPETGPAPGGRLPGLAVSLLPVLYPLLAISAHTMVSMLAGAGDAGPRLLHVRAFTALLGDPNAAMLASAAMAILIWIRTKHPGRKAFRDSMENALMSAGVIILITSAGGAFGAMLKAARLGPAVQDLFTAGTAGNGGTAMLFMGFLMAFIMKFAQGSSTVAMITASAMIAAMIPSRSTLGFHPVYLAAAVGFGAQCGNWMNDSGFWLFAKMGGFTELETLKTWTVTVSLMAVCGFLITWLFSAVLPLI